MGLLKEAKAESCYLKAGILGFPKAGKTYTSFRIALGLIKYIESKKPLAVIDTETGSDFWVKECKKEGVVMVRAPKSRAFQDLVAVVKEAEQDCDVLIIDSITHFWKNFMESYMKRMKRTRLTFGDWNVLKPKWAEFTDLFLNSKIHIIMCGRAGWEYDFFDGEDGKKELIKTGTKMKAEGEMGYEPSLLLEMERYTPERGVVGQKIIHRCHVIGDRTPDKETTLDGKVFDNPVFEDFLPHIKSLNLGGVHVGIDTTRTSEAVFDKEGYTEQWHKEQRHKVLLEEIEAHLNLKYPSQKVEDKQAKLACLGKVFKTLSWTKVGLLPIKDLEAGLSALKNGNEAEASPEPEPAPKTSDNTAYLTTMAAEKERVGSKRYYEVLGSSGYEHAAEITSRTAQKKVYNELNLLISTGKPETYTCDGCKDVFDDPEMVSVDKDGKQKCMPCSGKQEKEKWKEEGKHVGKR